MRTSEYIGGVGTLFAASAVFVDGCAKVYVFRMCRQTEIFINLNLIDEERKIHENYKIFYSDSPLRDDFFYFCFCL